LNIEKLKFKAQILKNEEANKKKIFFIFNLVMIPKEESYFYIMYQKIKNIPYYLKIFELSIN
jgi:hypothetical protein